MLDALANAPPSAELRSKIQDLVEQALSADRASSVHKYSVLLLERDSGIRRRLNELLAPLPIPHSDSHQRCEQLLQGSQGDARTAVWNHR
jgi:hypothetical protein